MACRWSRRRTGRKFPAPFYELRPATNAVDGGTYRLHVTAMTEYCPRDSKPCESSDLAGSVDMKRYVGLAAVILLLCASNRSSTAQNLPSYMAPIAGKTAATASDTATKDILALNTGMFELYGDAAKIFQKNFLNNHPVILGFFPAPAGGLSSIFPEC